MAKPLQTSIVDPLNASNQAVSASQMHERGAFSRKVAFTKPSRGTSEARDEQESTGTLSSRCDCERCRLMRGAVARKSRKIAFTLAEVLITLGIIGVVAALTLPSVISNYQKKLVSKRLAKSYSIVSNAIEMAKVEHGDISSWDIPKTGVNQKITGDYIDTYFLPYIDYSKKIGWMAFREFYDIKPYSGSGGYFVKLKDGTVLTFAFSGAKDKDNNLYYNYMYYYVDINGKTQPNKIGRDRFSFAIVNGKVVASRVYCNTPRPNIIQACKDGEPDACTQLIFMNNWEIPDDYPRKI